MKFSHVHACLRIAVVLGVGLAPGLVGATPSCPPGALLLYGNGSVIYGSTVACIVPGSIVPGDIQTYGSSTMYSEAQSVQVDVESYADSTIHILSGTIGANIDAYSDSTIHVYDAVVGNDIVSYTNSTINVHRVDLAGRLLLTSDTTTINVFAASLSTHDFGAIDEVTGSLVGTFADGSAFSLDFARSAASTLRVVAVPEPGTFALVTLGLTGLGVTHRRRLTPPR